MAFNVRAYGILEHPVTGALLLTQENLNGFAFTKFPGGGVQWGEGPEDAVIREFKEECLVDAIILGHVYTTGFFQESAFTKGDQIISIYYRMTTQQWDAIPLYERVVNEEQKGQHFLTCFWADKMKLRTDDFTFPIDRHVLQLISGGQ